MIIDFHSHVTTRSYFDKLLRMERDPRITKNENGTYKMRYDGLMGYQFDERTYSIEKRLEELRKAKVDAQVISLSLPGVDLFDKPNAVQLARESNDEIAEIAEKHAEFIGIATVPLVDVQAAIEEMERAIRTLGLKGVSISSNVNGKSLDAEEFWPFYQKAEQLDIPVMIHPTKPVMVDAVRDYSLASVVGYLFDSTLAMLKIILGGVLEKYKGLKLVLPHAGSTVPFVIGRVDHKYTTHSAVGERISKKPSEYFKSVYIDTAQVFYKPALMCAYTLSGPDKTLFGSDVPFTTLEQSLSHVQDMGIPESEKEKILGKNAAKLLKLK